MQISHFLRAFEPGFCATQSRGDGRELCSSPNVSSVFSLARASEFFFQKSMTFESRRRRRPRGSKEVEEEEGEKEKDEEEEMDEQEASRIMRFERGRVFSWEEKGHGVGIKRG